MIVFTATRLHLDNIIFPNRLEVSDENVIHYKGVLFGYYSTVIARRNITSVFINNHIVFADIVIETIGGNRVVATGFMKADARSIVDLLK